MFSFSFVLGRDLWLILGSGVLRTALEARYSPRGKIGRGLGFGAGLGSGLQLAESEQGLDILWKKGPLDPSEVFHRWNWLTRRGMSQYNVLFCFGVWENPLNFLNYVGKLYTKQVWCLQKCLNVFLVNVLVSPLSFDYNMTISLLGLLVICNVLHTDYSFIFNYRFISPTKIEVDFY